MGLNISLGGQRLSGVDNVGVEWLIGRDGIKGWWSSPAPRLSTGNRVRRHGAWVGDSWLTARTVTIDGWVFAASHAAAEDALSRLAVAASLDDTVLTVSGGASTTWARVRRSDDVQMAWITDREARWSISLLAADPRRLGVEMTGSSEPASVRGGLRIGQGRTLGQIPFRIESHITAGIVRLNSPGNITGPVVCRIDGPVVAPMITHVGPSGTHILSLSLTLGDREWVTVDMDRREVLAQGTEPRNSWVVSREWSGFEPGANSWAYSARDGAGLMTVLAVPAWM